jgi:transcriptional/translational regulatory protein YebC/TACO1
MGRVFEKRKHKMFARYAKMSKAFTKFGKEIHIAVKAGGTDPESNSRLRAIIANAKAANMPKANIDAAINRANNKDEKNFEAEKVRLIEYINRALESGADYFDNLESHSFGRLNKNEWNNMFYKHLDHHLRQFGA